MYLSVLRNILNKRVILLTYLSLILQLGTPLRVQAEEGYIKFLMEHTDDSAGDGEEYYTFNLEYKNKEGVVFKRLHKISGGSWGSSSTIHHKSDPNPDFNIPKILLWNDSEFYIDGFEVKLSIQSSEEAGAISLTVVVKRKPFNEWDFKFYDSDSKLVAHYDHENIEFETNLTGPSGESLFQRFAERHFFPYSNDMGNVFLFSECGNSPSSDGLISEILSVQGECVRQE